MIARRPAKSEPKGTAEPLAASTGRSATAANAASPNPSAAAAAAAILMSTERIKCRVVTEED